MQQRTSPVSLILELFVVDPCPFTNPQNASERLITPLAISAQVGAETIVQESFEALHSLAMDTFGLTANQADCIEVTLSSPYDFILLDSANKVVTLVLQGSDPVAEGSYSEA